MIAAAARTSGPSYDAEAAAYFTAAGITDAGAKTAINDFIVGLKSDFAITALTDVFDQLTLQANESAAAAVVDMCGRLDQTLVNSPTFAQWQGVTSASTKYIDTGFNPTTGGSKFVLNSHCWGGYMRAPSSGSSYLAGSINVGFAGMQIAPNNGGGTSYGGDGGVGLSPSIPGTGQTGLWAMSRTASNATAFYAQGTSLGTDTGGTSPGLLNQKFGLLCRNNNGSFEQPTTGQQVALSFFSRGMTSGEMSAFSARVATLKTAIGW